MFCGILLIQIVFEAVRGGGYQSDVALDEIRMIPGQCLSAQPGVPTTPIPLPTTKEIRSRNVVGKSYNKCRLFVFSSSVSWNTEQAALLPRNFELELTPSKPRLPQPHVLDEFLSRHL